MQLFRTPQIFRWMFPRKIWGFSSKDTVYLTFDDGPTPTLTPWILSTLEHYHAQATFFCVGNNAKNYPELMESIRAQGHSIGNHTMRHEKGTNTSKKGYLQSIEEAAPFTSTTLFRPPYGRLPLSFISPIRKKYHIVMWSWLSYDFDQRRSVEIILKRAEKIKPGDILVLHDNEKVEIRIKELLPALIELLQSKGYRFDVILD